MDLVDGTFTRDENGFLARFSSTAPLKQLRTAGKKEETEDRR